MPAEACGICGTQVPLGDTVHLLVHTKSEEGIVDYYVCKTCYDEEIAPLFE